MTIPNVVTATPIASPWGNAVADAVNGLERRVKVNNFNNTAVTSGDIATETLVMGAFGWNAIAGHLYEIDVTLTIVFATGTGAAGAALSLQVNNVSVQTHDAYLSAPNVAPTVFLRFPWLCPATAAYTTRLMMNKSWWSANPVRFTRGAATPMVLTVTDLGIPA